MRRPCGLCKHAAVAETRNLTDPEDIAGDEADKYVDLRTGRGMLIRVYAGREGREDNSAEGFLQRVR